MNPIDSGDGEYIEGKRIMFTQLINNFFNRDSVFEAFNEANTQNTDRLECEIPNYNHFEVSCVDGVFHVSTSSDRPFNQTMVMKSYK